MTGACDGCLRRGRLLARLAPRIAGLLDRPRGRPLGLLTLSDDELIDAVAPRHGGELRAELAGFDSRAERARLDAVGAGAACAHRTAYPAPLRELVDAPAVVYWHGASPTSAPSPAVAIVGARRASTYGMEVAGTLGRELGGAGVAVVSGLALGIDAAAHRGCVEAGGHAIAVMPGGPDLAYPWRNRALYSRVRRSGTVLSELPPGQRAYRWSFPARNRIMAGLAALTVVVEAGEPSGSLISADFARDLGRTVGAVPGPVTSRFAAGSNRLLQDGAEVITSTDDVLDRLFGVGVRTAPRPPPAPLDPVARAVLNALDEGSDVTAVGGAAGLAAGEARAALARLEAAGAVTRDALGGYVRAARC